MSKIMIAIFFTMISSLANAYVNLVVISDYGSYVVANGVNPTNLYLNCDLVETRQNMWGYTVSNVVGSWSFAPGMTRTFNLPKNGSYFKFACY
ncbi:hypothetical protein D3C71_622450 [compost metagenome]